jgi:hypothetical protein
MGCGTLNRMQSVTQSDTPSFIAADMMLIRVYDAAGNVIGPVGLVLVAAVQSNIRRISRVCHPFAFTHHRHELLFNGGGSFRRAQAERE